MNAQVSVTDLFSREEIQELTEPSDAYGAWAVASTWAVIGGTFASLIMMWDYLPSWGKLLACMLALAVLAGRQLCLAILMHDASHKSLFKNKKINDFVGEWLCARPIWNDLQKYRVHHVRHHAKTSTPDDPDLSLVAGFPVSKQSLTRKFLRDLTGITGLKFSLGRVLMDLDVMKWTVANDQIWLDRSDKISLTMQRVLQKQYRRYCNQPITLWCFKSMWSTTFLLVMAFGLFDSISIIFKNSFNGRTCRYANQQYCFN